MLLVRMMIVMSQIVTICISNNVIIVDILLAQSNEILFFLPVQFVYDFIKSAFLITAE